MNAAFRALTQEEKKIQENTLPAVSEKPIIFSAVHQVN